MGSRSAPIGTPVVCQVHELDQQVGPHVARGPTSVLIHSNARVAFGFLLSDRKKGILGERPLWHL